MSDMVTVDRTVLVDFVARIFAAVGVPEDAAAYVAELLVEADEEGIASHGVLLVPMYVDRIRNGSVSLATGGQVVRDLGAVAVIDAGNVLGQLSARQAVAIAAAKARQFGIGAVAVRSGFHFGTAGRFALDLVAEGCIGIVACNTRPLLPAPGGAEALVGNNPLAIAFPTNGDGPPALLDMATSASAMGKIRMAAASGETIPPDWATDANGVPTTDPDEAINGMLLPTGGPKGFGLAFMIDLLCGALSSGGLGAEVKPLYGDPAQPYNCAHFFLALDVAHFRDPEELVSVVTRATDTIRTSRRAPGVDRIYGPGELAWQTRRTNRDGCPVRPAVWADLCSVAETLGVSSDGCAQPKN